MTEKDIEEKYWNQDYFKKKNSVGKAEDVFTGGKGMPDVRTQSSSNVSSAPKSEPEKEKCEHEIWVSFMESTHCGNAVFEYYCKRCGIILEDYLEEIRNQTRKETNEINKEYYEFVKKETAKAIFEDMDKIVCLNVSAFSPTIEEYSKIRKKYGVDA